MGLLENLRTLLRRKRERRAVVALASHEWGVAAAALTSIEEDVSALRDEITAVLKTQVLPEITSGLVPPAQLKRST
jgi:hypothetical protein